MKSSSNLNISCKVVFSLNKWNKKVGSPSSFRRKQPFISLNSSASIENLSSSERARARARANHAKNDAQKGCAMQLNGITLRYAEKEKQNGGGRRGSLGSKLSVMHCGYIITLINAVLQLAMIKRHSHTKASTA